MSSAVYGAVLPDLVDKPILFMGGSPYGRTVGHSILIFALFCLCWLWCRIRRDGQKTSVVVAAHAYLLWGWGSHFVVDLLDDLVAGVLFNGYLFSGWMGWPWTDPDTWELRAMPVTWPCRECYTPLELTVVLGVIAWVYSTRRPRNI